MKVKLLKKIRKRFDYLTRTSNDGFILVDKKLKTLDYITEKYYEKDFKTIEVPKPEYLFRIMKGKMLSKFGYTFQDIMFKSAMRRVENKNKIKIK